MSDYLETVRQRRRGTRRAEARESRRQGGWGRGEGSDARRERYDVAAGVCLELGYVGEALCSAVPMMDVSRLVVDRESLGKVIYEEIVAQRVYRDRG